MRARILVLLTLVVVGAVGMFGGTAHAKGPSDAEITGAGITTPIPVPPEVFSANLIEETGFFAAAFGQEPNPMLATAPRGELGPRFTIAWSLPWSDGGPTKVDEVEQDLYPYADGGPVVYTAPGQTFYVSEHTRGGWFRAPTTLVTRLQTLGIPDLATYRRDRGSRGRRDARPFRDARGSDERHRPAVVDRCERGARGSSRCVGPDPPEAPHHGADPHLRRVICR